MFDRLMDGWKQAFHKYLPSIPEALHQAQGLSSEVHRTYTNLLPRTPLTNK